MNTKNNSNDSDNLQRLQKVLAAGGVGSRRQCEELILEGRVEVDRQVVTQLGTRVDPESQAIRVDGIVLKQRRRQYFAVHKPAGVVSTSHDPAGRTRVIDLVDSRDRVFSIGRLDKESSGLILVTNDGELANQLTHPRYEVQKTYHVTVAGTPNTDVIQKLRRGVTLSDGPVKPESVRIKKRLKQSTLLEIVLAEGRNREIRRMLARLDHKVLKLERIAIGPIRLGELPKSAHRELTRDEIKKLKVFGTSVKPSAAKRRRKRPSSVGSWSNAGAKSGRKPKSAGKSKPGTNATTGGLAPTARRSKTKLAKGPKMGAVIGGGGSGGSGSKSKRPKKRSS